MSLTSADVRKIRKIYVYSYIYIYIYDIFIYYIVFIKYKLYSF